MRIDKFISEAKIASRKEAALAARRGGVTVDGEPVRDLSRHINPEFNKVSYLGREIVFQKNIYVMLNKPEGYVSATEDSSLPVVTDLLSEELRKRELFPVGRLDKDTVGLMILTNNGQLAHTLLSPKRHVEKEYYFKAAEPLPEGVEERFKDGVTLRDGYECKSAEIKLLSCTCFIFRKSLSVHVYTKSKAILSCANRITESCKYRIVRNFGFSASRARGRANA
jgi:16S rRNA pseudouridine516 synthase